ncbi:Hypothetical protein GLP15_5141 [Giardia lamblia P15]|uniref:Tom40 n=1 Tax=Giardia intestinalis (strain P15) TaxID=658858 RepID=E1EW73_GIAIA|nr:Hypothetical protein GLP15_5141 [Giardia lamblia P15]
MPFPGLFRNGNYPGEYAHLAQDAEAVLNDKAYDSFNLVSQHNLTPHTSLTTMLTTSHRGPPKITESFSTVGPRGSFRGSIDSQGTLSGSYTTSVLPGSRYRNAARLRLLGDVHSFNTEKSKKIMATSRAELHIEGGDYSLSGLYSLPGHIIAGSYLQGLGDKMAVGCEIVRPPQTDSSVKLGASPIIMAAGGIRYTNISRERSSDPGIIVTAQMNTEKTANASLLAQLSGEFAVAASVNADFCGLRPPEHKDTIGNHSAPSGLLNGLRRTRLSASCGFTKLSKSSQVTVNCNTYGEACCDVRYAMQDGTVAEVIGSLDIFSGRTTVGVGLVLSEQALPRFIRKVARKVDSSSNHQ